MVFSFGGHDNGVTIKCNYRSCLDQRGGQCTAKEIEVIDGRCSSISRSKDAMKSDVPPMERNARGALANKQR